MDERLEEVLADLSRLIERVDDLAYDALRTQARGGEDAESAKEFERQVAKVRRALAKAEQAARGLAD